VRQPFRLALRVLLVLAACSAAAGCGPTIGATSAPSGALALVVGGHANAPEPAPLPPVRALLEQAAAEAWQTTAVVDGGTPEVIAHGHLRTVPGDAEAVTRQRTEMADKLEVVIREGRTDRPEVDLLAALRLAADSLSVTRGPKTLVVIDSGLQTVAPLTFQDRAMWGADPGTTADYLAERRALPRLSGVRLLLTGIGETAPPQPPLSTEQRAALVAIWTAIGQRAGATVEVLGTPLGTPARAGLPRVAVVGT
jgi:hypothetical protein